jgi:hypothetical protein
MLKSSGIKKTSISSRRTISSIKEFPSVKADLQKSLEETNQKFKTLEEQSDSNNYLPREVSFLDLFESELLLLKTSLFELLMLSHPYTKKFFDEDQEYSILMVICDLIPKEDFNAILSKQVINVKATIIDTKIEFKKPLSTYKDVKKMLLELHGFIKRIITYYLNKKTSKENIVHMLRKQTTSIGKLSINPFYIKLDNLLTVLNVIFDKFQLMFRDRISRGGTVKKVNTNNRKR